MSKRYKDDDGGGGGGGDDDDDGSGESPSPHASPTKLRNMFKGDRHSGKQLVATSITRRARPLSPTRLAHILAKMTQSQYKMQNRDQLIQQKIEKLFVQ
jgi:hypothetical protein